ncbi:MAG: hypothetical protein M5R36_12525 [Deltaproteobacteria bacterium]|nr:hypothetical protein [Deltaproteobacteria bacterium]
MEGLLRILAAIAWVVPSALAAKRVFPGRSVSEKFLIAIAVLTCVVSPVSTFFVMALRIRYTFAVLAAAGLATLGWAMIRRPEKRTDPPDALGLGAARARGGDVSVLPVSVSVQLFFFNDCIAERSFVNVRGAENGVNPGLAFENGQRIGSALFIVPWVTLFEYQGFAVASALAMTMAVLGVYIVVSRLAGPPSAFFAAAVLAAFTPAPALVQIDENFLAFGVAAIFFALVGMRARLLAGAALALLLSVRPEMTFVIPLLVVLRKPLHISGRPFWIAFAVLTVPQIAHRVAVALAMGALWVSESHMQFEKGIPHAFLGIPFFLSRPAELAVHRTDGPLVLQPRASRASLFPALGRRARHSARGVVRRGAAAIMEVPSPVVLANARLGGAVLSPSRGPVELDRTGKRFTS